MKGDRTKEILQDPKFKALAKKKRLWSVTFSALMFLFYVTFIGSIALAPDFIGQPMAEGVHATIGMTIGLAVIIIAIALTGIYVWKANGDFETMNREVVDEFNKGQAGIGQEAPKGENS